MQTNLNESQVNLAKHFVREAIVKQYGSDYSNCDELIDFAAEDYIKEYNLGKGSASGNFFTAADQSASFDSGEAVSTVFPQDFNLDVGIGSIKIHVTNPESGKYIATTKCTIFGITLSDSSLEFNNGELSRSETIGKGPLEFKYRISLDFSNGFHLRFEGSGYVDYWVGKKTFHVGPYDLNV